LWRLKVSDKGFIVGEDRNVEQKTVSYFCLKEKNGEVLWKNLTFEEKFWIGINAVYGERVYFHEFKSPSMPEEKKIIAVDLSSGNTAWKNDELKFLFAYNDCVYASKESFTSRLFFELDCENGNILRELGDDIGYINTLQETSEHSQPYNHLQLPTAILKDDFLRNEEYVSLLKTFRRHKITGDVELYENENFLAFTLYENANDNPFEFNLNQYLIIAEKGKSLKQVFSETITTNASMTLLDTFFFKENILYFIKEKKTLTAVSLVS